MKVVNIYVPCYNHITNHLESKGVFMVKSVFQLKTKPHGIQRYEEFIKENKIGIGWPGISNLSNVSKEELRSRLRVVYGYSGARLRNALGAIWAFIDTMKEGDIVMIRKGSLVSIGLIGPYQYEEQLDNDTDGFCHQRSVDWIVVDEDASLFNEKVRETLNHRGIVTKCKYDLSELELGSELM
jgi:predicted Mrr-cat superfamily restriction endonuclease